MNLKVEAYPLALSVLNNFFYFVPVLNMYIFSASVSSDFMALYKMLLLLLLFFFIPSGVKIPRVKSKVKSKRKAEVVTPRR